MVHHNHSTITRDGMTLVEMRGVETETENLGVEETKEMFETTVEIERIEEISAETEMTGGMIDTGGDE